MSSIETALLHNNVDVAYARAVLKVIADSYGEAPRVEIKDVNEISAEIVVSKMEATSASLYVGKADMRGSCHGEKTSVDVLFRFDDVEKVLNVDQRKFMDMYVLFARPEITGKEHFALKLAFYRQPFVTEAETSIPERTLDTLRQDLDHRAVVSQPDTNKANLPTWIAVRDRKLIQQLFSDIRSACVGGSFSWCIRVGGEENTSDEYVLSVTKIDSMRFSTLQRAFRKCPRITEVCWSKNALHVVLSKNVQHENKPLQCLDDGLTTIYSIRASSALKRPHSTDGQQYVQQAKRIKQNEDAHAFRVSRISNEIVQHTVKRHNRRRLKNRDNGGLWKSVVGWFTR